MVSWAHTHTEERERNINTFFIKFQPDVVMNTYNPSTWGWGVRRLTNSRLHWKIWSPKANYIARNIKSQYEIEISNELTTVGTIAVKEQQEKRASSHSTCTLFNCKSRASWNCPVSPATPGLHGSWEHLLLLQNPWVHSEPPHQVCYNRL